MTTTQRACGSWPSPITAAMCARRPESSFLSGAILEPRVGPAAAYWLSSRPQESGRSTLMRWVPGSSPEELVSAPWNVRTRIHEYGGGAYAVGPDVLWFSHFADGRLYSLRGGAAPAPLTPPGPWRYGDLIYDARRRRLVAVREDTGPGDHTVEPVAELVSINIETGAVTALFGGYDFLSSPRLSPDGENIAWVAWNHPNMPWDDTVLLRARCHSDGTLANVELERSAVPQARMQPDWSPDGELWYVSDADGWWNLYRWPQSADEGVRVTTLSAEIGMPAWLLGMRHWAFVDADRIVIVFTEDGYWRCGTVDRRTGRLLDQSEPWPSLTSPICLGMNVYVIGADAQGAAGLYRYVNGGLTRVIAATDEFACEGATVSVARPLVVPLPATEHTDPTETCHAWFYRPVSPDYEPLPHEAPPVIVQFHGGPTAASHCAFSLSRQFWTSRGFAVIDVNYRGSTGRGRAYRHRLYGLYGILDVEDAVAAVRHAADLGLVDASRAISTGASSGGYTTLAALAFHDVFAAGINIFGIGDLSLFQTTAHKFESRFLETLVGTPFEQRCRERSPLSKLEAIHAPLITFQGSDDKIVPPAQSHAIVDALRIAGVPCAYVEFEGEGHGFRRHDTMVKVLEQSVAFVRAVLGLPAEEPMDPVNIENAHNLQASASSQ
jgi:dipeptidyl aminopeptidase/acylaminoacyl peptidase